MRQIHIINPAAGNCKAEEFLPNYPVEIYRSTGVEDITRFVFETASLEPDTHFIAYGGDGTLNEVVNGVMLANAGDRAKISCVPTGTGNDFVRNFEGSNEPVRIDVIRYNDRYAINMLNIGFDCDVVTRTTKLKKMPFVHGPFAYILGVLGTLCRPMGHKFALEVVTENDEHISIEDNLLLIAIGNGAYCGGGFYAMPTAKQDDGLLDLLVINKIGRMKFLSLVGDYKAGTYLDRETGEILPKFKDIITTYRVKQVTLHNMYTLCADGEVYPLTDAIVTVLPRAITYVPFSPTAQANADNTSNEPALV